VKLLPYYYVRALLYFSVVATEDAQWLQVPVVSTELLEQIAIADRDRRSQIADPLS
jgi:hypothetical protein